MIEAQVPEFFDGGYWYASHAEGGEPTAEFEFYGAAFGEVAGVMYAAVRTPYLVAAPPVVVKVSEILESAHANGSLPSDVKFLSRLNGN